MARITCGRFCEVSTCGFSDMQTDRQTDRRTDCNTLHGYTGWSKDLSHLCPTTTTTTTFIEERATTQNASTKITLVFWDYCPAVPLAVLNLSQGVHTPPPHHNRFTALSHGPPGEPMPEENFWSLWCKGRLTEADTLKIRLGATPSGLTSAQQCSQTRVQYKLVHVTGWWRPTTGKVIITTALHWARFTNITGLSTYRLNGPVREMSNTLQGTWSAPLLLPNK